MPGELNFIAWLRRQQHPGADVLLPPGDDLAVLNWDAADLLLVGVDQVLDGVHFDSAVHDPRGIGRKVMNRNLSDCAAMASLPAAAVAAVALPQSVGIDYAKELYLGLRDAADPFDCPIVGGDTGSWPGKLAISVTILGRSAGIAPVKRSGAKPDDFIYVSGALGGSIAGRHMTFEPRIALARELAGERRVNAMIDISDGLARDLRHICQESGVGAVLDAGSIPIHSDALKLAADDRTAALQRALGDGEDYELLLTSPDDLRDAGVIRIGRITAAPSLLLRSDAGLTPLPTAGWEHAL
jgi:thiamine-monophosphate kinase